MRVRQGKAPLAPRPDLSQASDLVRMALGESSPGQPASLEAYLVTVSDRMPTPAEQIARNKEMNAYLQSDDRKQIEALRDYILTLGEGSPVLAAADHGDGAGRN